MSYCEHGFGRCPSCDGALSIEVRAVNALIDVQALLVQAFGRDLDAPERSNLVASCYLAQIRDRLRGMPSPPAAPPCPDCVDLRVRLTNIYHLTLTGQDALSTVRAVRAASGPGAPAPSARAGVLSGHASDCPGCAAGGDEPPRGYNA